MIVEYHALEKFEKVTLGDGHGLDAVGCGTVRLVVKLPGGKTKRLKVLNTLFVLTIFSVCQRHLRLEWRLSSVSLVVGL